MIRGEGGHFCAGAHRDALGAAGSDPGGAGRYRDLSAIYESVLPGGAARRALVGGRAGLGVGAGVN